MVRSRSYRPHKCQAILGEKGSLSTVVILSDAKDRVSMVVILREATDRVSMVVILSEAKDRSRAKAVQTLRRASDPSSLTLLRMTQ